MGNSFGWDTIHADIGKNTLDICTYAFYAAIMAIKALQYSFGYKSLKVIYHFRNGTDYGAHVVVERLQYMFMSSCLVFMVHVVVILYVILFFPYAHSVVANVSDFPCRCSRGAKTNVCNIFIELVAA